MGLFGGSKSSSTQTTNYNTVNENDQLTTESGVIANRGANVTITDAGSTKQALDFANDVSGNQTKLVNDLYDTSAGLTRSIIDTTKSIFNSSLDSYDAASNRAYNFAGDSYAKALGLVTDANESILAQNRDTVDAISNASKTASNQIAQAYSNANTGNTYIDPKYLWFGALALAGLIFVFRK